jgi:hypothetical protein
LSVAESLIRVEHVQIGLASVKTEKITGKTVVHPCFLTVIQQQYRQIIVAEHLGQS